MRQRAGEGQNTNILVALSPYPGRRWTVSHTFDYLDPEHELELAKTALENGATFMITVGVTLHDPDARVVITPEDADQDAPGHQYPVDGDFGLLGDLGSLTFTVTGSDNVTEDTYELVLRSPYSDCVIEDIESLTITGEWERDCFSIYHTGRGYGRYYGFEMADEGQVTIDLATDDDWHLLVRRGGEDGVTTVDDIVALAATTSTPAGHFPTSINAILSEGSYVVEVVRDRAYNPGEFTLTITGDQVVTTGDDHLASLSLSGVSVDFDPEVQEYTLSDVDAALTSATVTAAARAAEQGAVVTIRLADGTENPTGNQVSLDADGETEFQVVVTAPNETDERVYRITLVQDALLDATLSSLSLTGITLTGFDPGVAEYTVEAGDTITTTTVNAAASETGSGATVDITPCDADPSDGCDVELEADGETEVVIAVTAGNGIDRQVYRVNVDQPARHEAALSRLTFSGLNLDHFDPAVFSYFIDLTPARPTETTVDAEAAHAVLGATVNITPEDSGTAHGYQVELDASGQTVIEVAVTAADGVNTNVYRVVIFPGFILDGPRGRVGGIWSDGATMWVTDRIGGKLSAHVLATGKRDASQDIARPSGNRVSDAIWSDGTTMWIVDSYEVPLRVVAYSWPDMTRESAKDFTLLDSPWAALARDMWSDGTTMWIAEGVVGGVRAYHLKDDPMTTGVDEYGTVNNDLGIFPVVESRYTLGLTSDGETMWVAVSYQDHHALVAYQLSSLTRDPRRDIPLAPHNSRPWDLWTDGTTMWVLDLYYSGNGAVFRYRYRHDASGLAITGTVATGNTLTADTSGVSDGNGIPSDVTYTYRWQRLGSNSQWEDIASETGSTYTVVATDVGASLRVCATFADTAGYVEELCSDAVS